MKDHRKRSSKELKDVLELAADVRARELRVDEARDFKISQGEITTVREGLPRTGAVEGVTYRDVRVRMTVRGRPPR